MAPAARQAERKALFRGRRRTISSFDVPRSVALDSVSGPAAWSGRTPSQIPRFPLTTLIHISDFQLSVNEGPSAAGDDGLRFPRAKGASLVVFAWFVRVVFRQTPGAPWRWPLPAWPPPSAGGGNRPGKAGHGPGCSPEALERPSRARVLPAHNPGRGSRLRP